MSSAITQTDRRVALKSPLGDDVLMVQSLTLRDELGRPWSVDLDLRSENDKIKFEDVVGHAGTIRIDQPDGKKRYIHGYFSRLVQEGVPVAGAMNRYRATLVPWLWFTTRTSDCRIFQEKTVVEIVKEVLGECPGNDVRDALTYKYPKLEYCVQYRETDFNFVSRLMEENGIYYFFEHQDGRHTMVLADAPSVHQTIPNYDKIPFVPREEDTERERVMEWTLEKQLQPTKFAHRGFDFKAPRKSVAGDKQITRQHGANQFEVYDHPCVHIEAADAAEYARVRAEELAARYEIGTARSNVRALTVGAKFKLTSFPRQDQNRDYVVIGMTLHASNGGLAAGSAGTASSGEQFEISFQAIDAKTPFHSPRLSVRPVVHGPQTAIVTGPDGEEIYTDEHGRVKVHFHWHRYDKADEKSSCWMRVSQAWAGKQWGAIYLPRIGQEVVVSFLEGDPDRPLVTGRVYNGDNKPPYELPGNKTMSTLKSLSSKGGGGFNEIRFEDKKGSEQIFVHGEKDADVRIKNDVMEWVGHDRNLVVKNDQIEHVEHDRQEKVDHDHSEEIGNDRNLKVVGKEAKQIGKTYSLKVMEDVAEVFQKNHSEQVTNDYYLKADNICIEATTNITIKVGQSHIAIEAGGITIGTSGEIKVESTGPTNIKATGPLKAESAAAAELKGALATVKADGVLTIQGGIVKIN